MRTFPSGSLVRNIFLRHQNVFNILLPCVAAGLVTRDPKRELDKYQVYKTLCDTGYCSYSHAGAPRFSNFLSGLFSQGSGNPLWLSFYLNWCNPHPQQRLKWLCVTNIGTKSSLKGPESAKSGHIRIWSNRPIPAIRLPVFLQVSYYIADFCLYIKLIDNAYEMAPVLLKVSRTESRACWNQLTLWRYFRLNSIFHYTPLYIQDICIQHAFKCNILP